MLANLKWYGLAFWLAIGTIDSVEAQEIVKGTNGKLGYKNELNKLILPTEYDFIDVGMGDLFRLRFIAKKINPTTQEKVLSFADEVYHFSKDYQYGILETDYNNLIRCQYQRFLLHSDNMVLGLRSDNTWDAYAFSFSKKKAHLKKIFQQKYNQIEPVWSDKQDVALYKITNKNLQGLAIWHTKKGWRDILKPEYTQLTVLAQDEYNGICLAQKQGKWTIWDILGKKILDASYDDQVIFKDEKGSSDVLVALSQNGKKSLYHYYSERHLNLLLKADFEDIIADFSGQLAIVKQKGKWGLLTNIMETQQGEQLTWTLNPEYDLIQWDATNHTIIVQKDQRKGIFRPDTQLIEWQ